MNLKRSTKENGLIGGGRNVRPLHNRGVTLSGSDFLGKVTVKANPLTSRERILATYPITPSGFQGTRLTQLSQMWERYKFTSLLLRYVSAVPNTLACQLCLYIDTDPLDDPAVFSGDELIRQAVAQAGSQQWNFNRAASIPLAKRGDGQLYYTGNTKDNERFSQQGTAYLIQVTNPINFNGAVLENDLEAGSVFVDWSCYFETAQINPAIVEASHKTEVIELVALGTKQYIVTATGSVHVEIVKYDFTASSQAESITAIGTKITSPGVDPTTILGTCHGDDNLWNAYQLGTTGTIISHNGLVTVELTADQGVPIDIHINLSFTGASLTIVPVP
jgi:hypothetical protein